MAKKSTSEEIVWNESEHDKEKDRQKLNVEKITL